MAATDHDHDSRPAKASDAAPATAAMAALAATVLPNDRRVSPSTTGPIRAPRILVITTTCTTAATAVEAASPPTRSGVQISAMLSAKFRPTIHRLTRTGVAVSPSA